MNSDKSVYDGDLARLMAEARDLFKSANYTQAADKYLQAAKVQHESRGLEQAKDLYHEAIKNFIRASEEYKEKKQYRLSAQTLYQISEIYKVLNMKDDWTAVMHAVVSDLINAAQEYLLWNEYDRAITLVSSSCFLLFSLGDFNTAEKYYNQYVSKIQGDPGFTSAQQVLYAAGYAIKAIKDLDAKSLLSAQQLVGSHLKPHLSQMGGEIFLKAIDDAVDATVKVFRSKIKLPKIVPELIFSRDLVLNEPSEMTVHLENEGEGAAFNVNFQLNVPDEIEIIDGKREFTLEQLDKGKTYDHKLMFRCMSAVGSVTHEISGKISFYDQLQTKQTMMIGPYDLVFREVSLSKELSLKLADLETSNLKYKTLLNEKNILEPEIYERILDTILTVIREAEKDISIEEFERVKSSIDTLEKIFQILDEFTNDEFVSKINSKREEKIKERIEQAVEEAKNNLTKEFENKKAELIEQHKAELEKMEKDLKEKLENEKQVALDNLKKELEKKHESELKNLMDELESKHKKELDSLREDLTKERERLLTEQKKKLEEEKKKALEEQETLLQEEFQKRLSEVQSSQKS